MSQRHADHGAGLGRLPLSSGLELADLHPEVVSRIESGDLRLDVNEQAALARLYGKPILFFFPPELQ